MKAKKTPPTKSDRDLVRIATFILFDAAVFHESLTGSLPGIDSLRKATGNYQTFLQRQWERILHRNYVPVFGIAKEVLGSFPSSPRTEGVLRDIAEAALGVVSSGILLKHDFMGRVYHKLLLRTTGQYYATYYTSIPAAWLLSNLVFKTSSHTWDFSSLENLKRFRVVDPACGSGTLLSAAYMAIKDRYARSRPTRIDVDRLHTVLVESVLNGWDILDYATHLTLTTLALHRSRSSISRSSIFTLPAGVISSRGHQIVHLGSLDYLNPKMSFRGKGFAAPTKRKGFAHPREEEITDQKFDAVLMNPPFSRSAKPNIKFGYSTPGVRALMNKALSAQAKQLGFTGIGPAGLAPYFMLLASVLVKDGGRVGAVLPRSMLSGVSWEKIRRHYLRGFHLEYVVSNFDPGDKTSGIDPWCWSENTDLGEVLVSARRRSLPTGQEWTTYINFWNKPRNEVEALLAAQQAIRLGEGLSHSIEDSEWQEMSVGGRPVGSVYRVKQEALGRNWLRPAVFAHPQLNALALTLGGAGARCAALGTLTEQRAGTAIDGFGWDIAAVKGHFGKAGVKTEFGIVWGHQQTMNTIALREADVGYGRPKKGRSTERFFAEGSSQFLVAERPHLSTECLLAMHSPISVLTTAFWEIRLRRPEWEPLLLLWFNSTYGVLQYLSAATSSQGDIFKMKKEQLATLPVPVPADPWVEKADAFMTAVAGAPLLSFGREFALAAANDGVRVRIDRFLAKLLGLPAVRAEYYDLLSRDPVITRQRL